MEWTKKWCNLNLESKGWKWQKGKGEGSRETRDGDDEGGRGFPEDWKRFLLQFSFSFMSLFQFENKSGECPHLQPSLSLLLFFVKIKVSITWTEGGKGSFSREWERHGMMTGFPIHFLSKEAKFRLQLRFIIVNSEFSPSLLSFSLFPSFLLSSSRSSSRSLYFQVYLFSLFSLTSIPSSSFLLAWFPVTGGSYGKMKEKGKNEERKRRKEDKMRVRWWLEIRKSDGGGKRWRMWEKGIKSFSETKQSTKKLTLTLAMWKLWMSIWTNEFKDLNSISLSLIQLQRVSQANCIFLIHCNCWDWKF